jgi:4-amino-4-deoxy-L-arabinose transferase-like glycosyltransferase
VLAACSAGPWHAETTIAIAHCLLGLATVWLTLLLGRRWNLGSFAYFAAALVACDPILLNQSTLVMTETLAALLAVASLAFISMAVESKGHRHVAFAALAGASFGLAALCRPTFLLTLAFGIVAMAWVLSDWRQILKSIIAMCVAATCVLAPWGIRNSVQLGSPIITTTHGGYTVLLGNNPDYYGFLKTAPWRSVWHADYLDASLSKSRSADEVANDRHEYALAWQTIRDQPGMFLYASLLRVGALWSVLPHQISDNESSTARLVRYAIATWYVVVFSLALVGIFSDATHLTRSLWLFALALVASFTAAHFVYWTDMRMRAPLVPAISLFAAEGLKFLVMHWLKTSPPKTDDRKTKI